MVGRVRRNRRKTAHRKGNSTSFKPGDPRINRKGREPGTRNKFTDIKQALLESFEELGGREYLTKQGRKSPRSYLQILAKMLPTRLAGHDGGPLDHELQKFQAGLAALSEKELATFQELMKKISSGGPQ